MPRSLNRLRVADFNLSSNCISVVPAEIATIRNVWNNRTQIGDNPLSFYHVDIVATTGLQLDVIAVYEKYLIEERKVQADERINYLIRNTFENMQSFLYIPTTKYFALVSPELVLGYDGSQSDFDCYVTFLR